MSSKRMTANPIKPSRYRPGKQIAKEHSDSEGDDDVDSDEEQKKPTKVPPPPKVTSFPSEAKIASNLKNVNLTERRRQAEAQEKARKQRELAAQAKEEEGFVTASSSGEDDVSEQETPYPPRAAAVPTTPSIPQRNPPSDTDDDSDSDGNSEDSDSDSSSSFSAAPTHARPLFIPKAQRTLAPSPASLDTAQALASAARKQASADALVLDKLERDAAARAAGKANWDDDAPDEVDQVDDTDDLDPELERQQWVVRELARVKRARVALEEREKEIAEVERRRGMGEGEREREDRRWVEAQGEEKRGRGRMAHLQVYHHKGAFYREEVEKMEGVAGRDLMGARFVDQQGGGKEGMPEYLQVRDPAMVGRKGRTRYKDLKSEDTGRWGEFGRGAHQGRGGEFAEDERFRPDYGGGGGAAGTGANSSSLGERKRLGGEEGRVEDAKRARREGG